MTLDASLVAADAANSLLRLSFSPERTPPPTRRVSKEQMTTPEKPEKSPERHFKMTGVKRTRDPDLITVLYSSGTETMAVPFAKGETKEILHARRMRAAALLFDTTRSEVYCTWRKELVSMKTDDQRWTKFRDTFKEQRFLYNTLQLVLVKVTCLKQSSTSPRCLNCATPSRRMSCLTPHFYRYVMPMPTFHRLSENACESCLEDFDPLRVSKDATEWVARTPSLYLRST